MLLLDLFLVGIAAVAGGWVCRRFGVPEVLGYLAAGIVLGPSISSSSFVDAGLIKNLAQFAVVFRMFTLGLDFDARRLRGRWGPAFAAGGLEMGLCTLAGAGVAVALGWPLIEGAILGAALGTTSTNILSKALADRDMTTREDARAAGAATLTEDLIAMILLAGLAVFHGADGLHDVWENVLWLVVFASLAFTAGAILVPVGIDRLGRSRSDELLTLAVLGVMFGFAALSEVLGAGRPIGAFLAGIAVGAARSAPGVSTRVLPLRDLLAATAYVSIGLLLDPGVILSVAPLAAGVALLFVPLKVLATGLGLRLGGVPPVVAARAGAILGQVGTMGIVLACTPFVGDEAAARLMAFAFVAWAVTVGLTPLRLRFLPDLAEQVVRALGARERSARRGGLRAGLDRDSRHDLYAAFLSTGCALGIAALAVMASRGALAFLPADAVLPAGVAAGALAGVLVLPFVMVAAVMFRKALRRGVHRHALAPRRLARGHREGARTWSVTGTVGGLAVGLVLAASFAWALSPPGERVAVLAGLALGAVLAAARPRVLARLFEECEALVLTRPSTEARLHDFRGVSPFGVEVEGHIVRAGTQGAWRSLGDLPLKEQTGARVVAVLRQGAVDSAPATPTTVVHPGDELVVAGTPAQLESARRWLLQAPS